MKLFIYFLFFISLFAFGEDKYSDYFSQKSLHHEFFEKLYLEHEKRSIIIYSNEDNIDQSINRLSSLLPEKLGVPKIKFQRHISSQIKKGLKRNPYALIKAYNIYFRKENIRLCIIDDRKDIINRYLSGKKVNRMEVYFSEHELEHCYLSTTDNPIFSKEEFFNLTDDYDNKEKLYTEYMTYLNEAFADIVAIKKIMIREKSQNILNYSFVLRESLLKKRDYLHYSNPLVSSYFSTNSDDKLDRKKIEEFIYLNSLDIVPISYFISLK